MKRLLLLFHILSFSVLTAQPPSGMYGGGGDRPAWVIIGEIADEANEALPYVNVELIKLSDTSILASTTTDGEGKFFLPAEEVAPSFIKATYLSFSPLIIEELNMNSPFVNLGRLTMNANNDLLDEVVVEGERSTFELRADMRVFNVGNDLANTGMDALQVLENVPSLTIDQDGNVELRGSANVRILIDGKPSSLLASGTDGLRQIPANLLEKVEIITNPSARYDAEGEAGIINIVLKEEKDLGLNGSVKLQTGYPNNHGFTGVLNWNPGKFNFFSSYGFMYRKMPGEREFRQTYSASDAFDTSYSYLTQGEHFRGGLRHTARLGVEFKPTDKTTFEISGVLGLRDNSNGNTITYTDFNDANAINTIAQSTRTEDESEEALNWDLNASFDQQFGDNKDHRLSIEGRYSDSKDEEAGVFTQLYDTSISTSFANLYQINTNTENQVDWLAQADYTLPTGSTGKIELGGKATVRILENSYDVQDSPSEDGIYTSIPGLKNTFGYDEGVYAAYIQTNQTYGKFSFNVGLRGEETVIKANLLNTDTFSSTTNFDRRYFQLFPSASLSYALSDKHNLQLSYSRRLRRPWFRYLLPFSSYADARNFWRGNPDLNPAYTNSTELTYLYRTMKTTLMVSTYYRYRTGVIQRILVGGDDGITESIPVNLATENDWGLESNVNLNFSRAFRVNMGGTFFYSNRKGNYEDQDLSAETFGFRGRVSLNLTLWKKLKVQSGVNYSSPTQTPQGRSLAFSMWQAGVSIDVFKKNATFALNVNDILNTGRWRWQVETPTLATNGMFQWRQRNATMTFTYRFNQQGDRRYSGRPGGGMDMDMEF